MKEVLKSFPLHSVVQQLCTAAVHEKDRLRALSFRLLKGLVDKCCENTDDASTSNSIRKNIFPAITKTLIGVETKVSLSESKSKSKSKSKI